MDGRGLCWEWHVSFTESSTRWREGTFGVCTWEVWHVVMRCSFGGDMCLNDWKHLIMKCNVKDVCELRNEIYIWKSVLLSVTRSLTFPRRWQRVGGRSNQIQVKRFHPCLNVHPTRVVKLKSKRFQPCLNVHLFLNFHQLFNISKTINYFKF